MCLLTLPITEYPKSKTPTTSKILPTTEIKNKGTSRSTSTPELLNPITTHSYTRNQHTIKNICNSKYKHITLPTISTISIRQNRKKQATRTLKKPQSKMTTTSNKVILTSLTEVQTSDRIPKTFNTSQPTQATSNHTRPYQNKTSTKTKTLTNEYSNNIIISEHIYRPKPIELSRRVANKTTTTRNNSTTQRICLSSCTEHPLQVKTNEHHYQCAEKVYCNGLVLKSKKLDDGQNRFKTTTTETVKTHTYASCLKSSIDPIQQLLQLREAAKSQFNYFVSKNAQHNNKWKHQKHRKIQYQHRSQVQPTKRYYSRAHQQTLYCKSKRNIIKTAKTTEYKLPDRIQTIIDCNHNYYSAISDLEVDDIINDNNIASNCDIWDETKYINNTFFEPITITTSHHCNHSKPRSGELTQASDILQSQEYYINNKTKKIKSNNKFTNLLHKNMTRKLRKPSSVLQSLKQQKDASRKNTKEITKDASSTRSTKTTHSNKSISKETSTPEDMLEASDDEKSHASTVKITNRTTGNKEKWIEIKKTVNDNMNNPLCPTIPNAVPETILEKPIHDPNRSITPTHTIALVVTIKGPTNWEQAKGKRRKPIFKIRKILLGFLYAAQRVCPEARLANVSKAQSIPDIINIDDIPKTELSEKDFVFDAQVYRGIFQGQILIKANKEFSDFTRNSDFYDWMQMEGIQIKLQPHSGVKYIKIGFFMEVVNSLSMDKFHVSTLKQWLLLPVPPFELFSDTIYTTHEKKKYSCRVLYVLCKSEDRDELNEKIEALSNVIPWTYYETKYFHKFNSEIKSDKISIQKELHDSTQSYLIPGFIDNDTVLMNYIKHTAPTNTHDNLSSSTDVLAKDAAINDNNDSIEDDNTEDNMESEDNESQNNIDANEPALAEKSDDNNNHSKKSKNKGNHDNSSDSANAIIPNDYVGSFMEKYYKNEYEEHLYYQVGPVVENKREVLVFQDNHLYAEKMNQIIIADLSLHMTPEACQVCLDNDTIQQQLKVYKNWKSHNIENYMAIKNIYRTSDNTDKNTQIEQTNKRSRNDVPLIITTNNAIPNNNEKQIKAAAAEVFTDDFIDLVKQTTDKHLINIQQTHDNNKIDKAEFTTVINEWKTKFESLEKTLATQNETIVTQNTTMESLITTLNVNEIKTSNRFGTVYDTITTKCSEFENTVLKVKVETQEIYERAQEAYDTKHDELRKDNRTLNEKIDKLLGHFNKKPEKKLKSQQAIENFRDQLTHHTSDSMITEHHE